MNKSIPLIVSSLFLFSILAPLAGGFSITANPDDDLDGYIYSSNAVYATALAGPGTSDNTSEIIKVGQKLTGGIYTINRAYLSFDTSELTASQEIISATMNIHESVSTVALEAGINVYNVDYGASLTNADWGVTGDYEGTLSYGYLWWGQMSMSPNGINKDGQTQYKLACTGEGSPFTTQDYFYHSTNSSFPPYLTVSAINTDGAVVTYNFTSGNQAPSNATVEYWDEHILNKFTTGFEDGTFGVTNWTTYNSPVVTQSYAPYEGLYHAGASLSESGVGNHTFQVAVNATGLYNMTLSYYRKVQDAGGGSVSLIVDWYNGSAWKVLESLTLSAPYERSTWVLSSDADNNPDLIIRFNVTLSSGNNNNGAWIDDGELITKSGFHIHSTSELFVAEYTEWNDTHIQLRFDVFFPEPHLSLGHWEILRVNETLIFQSHTPSGFTMTNEGNGVYNMTGDENHGIYHSIWFLKPIYSNTTYEEQSNVHPTEIQSWNATAELLRYEVFSANESYIHFQLSDNHTFQAIHPYANVTFLNDTIAVNNETVFIADGTDSNPFYTDNQNLINHTFAVWAPGFGWYMMTWGTDYTLDNLTGEITLVPGWFPSTPGEEFRIWYNHSDYTGLINITETWDNTYYNIWYLRNLPDVQTTFFISMYDPFTKKGYPYETWDIYYSVGSSFNASNKTNIGWPIWELDYGREYTFGILDYYGNILAEQSVSANELTKHIKIPVPAYPLTIENQNDDGIRVRIYDASNLTNPQKIDVSGHWTEKSFLRGTDYTITVTYIVGDYSDQTVWFNKTVNDTTFFRFNGTGIYDLYEQNGVIVSWSEVITRDLQEDVEWLIDNPSYPRTGTRSGDGVPVIGTSPQINIWSGVKVANNGNTAAGATLWAGELNTTLMPGVVDYIKDTLRISAANNSAHLIVNDTTLGTTIINTTAPIGAEYDILNDHFSSRGNNLTVWVNNSAFGIIREIDFVWGWEISWNYRDDTNQYSYVANITNALDMRMLRPEILVTWNLATEPYTNSVSVYDVDRLYYLSSTTGYDIDNSGVGWEFTNLSVGESRNFRIIYFSENLTIDGIRWIEPEASPQWYQYGNDDMRYIYGSWVNSDGGQFVGELKFQMPSSETKNIDPETIIVLDLTDNKQIDSHYWIFTGSSIEFNNEYWPDGIAPGATVSIGVLYLTDEASAMNVLTDKVFAGLTWPALGAAAAIVLILLGLVTGGQGKTEKERAQSKKDGRTYINAGVGLALLDIGFVAMVILTV